VRGSKILYFCSGNISAGVTTESSSSSSSSSSSNSSSSRRVMAIFVVVVVVEVKATTAVKQILLHQQYSLFRFKTCQSIAKKNNEERG
jgi:hypothetical protein